RAPTPHLSPLSLHDALPICLRRQLQPSFRQPGADGRARPGLALAHRRDAAGGETMRRPHRLQHRQIAAAAVAEAEIRADPDLARSEEHTSELQSRETLVCRL